MSKIFVRGLIGINALGLVCMAMLLAALLATKSDAARLVPNYEGLSGLNPERIPEALYSSGRYQALQDAAVNCYRHHEYVYEVANGMRREVVSANDSAIAVTVIGSAVLILNILLVGAGHYRAWRSNS